MAYLGIASLRELSSLSGVSMTGTKAALDVERHKHASTRSFGYVYSALSRRYAVMHHKLRPWPIALIQTDPLPLIKSDPLIARGLGEFFFSKQRVFPSSQGLRSRPKGGLLIGWGCGFSAV